MRIFKLLLLIFSCLGCSQSFKQTLKIGIDRTWNAADFGAQTGLVNGFVTDLFMELSEHSGVNFELIYTNWDSLMGGLRLGQYDTVLTVAEPNEVNLSQYDFSPSILDTGAVLIVRKDQPYKNLKELKEKNVGIITNDPVENLIQKEPQILIRPYSSVPALLNALVSEEIEAAALDKILATSYVKDLYATSLTIEGNPLQSIGIYLLSLKGKSDSLNRQIESFKKKKRYQELLKKWSL